MNSLFFHNLGDTIDQRGLTPLKDKHEIEQDMTYEHNDPIVTNRY